MEETRAALQDKLETLEQQVKSTVETATEAVTTAKESVHETVESVKASVHETVESVKETFDLRLQVERHPWMMVCGAAAVGFLGGRLLEGIRAVSPTAPSNPAPPMSSGQFYPSLSRGQMEAPPRSPRSRTWMDTLVEQYSDELNKVKGLALSTVGGLVGEMLTEASPNALKEQVKEVVDGVIAKLGGHPLKEPLFSQSGNAKTRDRGDGVHREEKTSALGGMRRDWGEGMDRSDH